MKLYGKLGSVALAGAIVAGMAGMFTGCSEDTSKLALANFDFGDDYYRNVESRYTLNYDEMIYDDFTKGIDKNRWVISDTVFDNWGADHNGMRPQNVFLLNDSNNPDTHLLLRANGAYYSGKPLSANVDGVNTAACISSVEAFGPGRYDIKMKPCPRIGTLTSMWLFSWFNKDDGSIQQNEIDIEIGLKPEFDKVYFTTWTSPDNNSSFPVDTGFPVNDGDWHIYSFDWVTDAEVPYVDYYIDGVKMFTIDKNVPTTNATLSIGMWVPSWAGGSSADSMYNVSPNTRMFDQDYAEISWWRYIPFQMTNWEQRPVANRSSDPNYQVEVLTEMPTVNKCANGDFERADEEYYKTARNAVKELNEKIAAATDEDEIKSLQSGLATIESMLNVDPAPWKDSTVTDTESYFYIEDSTAGRVADPFAEAGTTNFVAQIQNGGMYGQWLRAAQSGFKYRITGKFRTTGDAVAALRYTNYLGFSTTSGTSGAATIEFGKSTDGWKEFSVEFTVDEAKQLNVKGIYYYLINSAATADNAAQKDKVYFDDINITYLGHN